MQGSNFTTSTSSTPTQLNKSSFNKNMICSLRQHSGDGGHGEESGDENCQVGLVDRPTQSKDTAGQSAKVGPQLIFVAISAHKIFPGCVVFSEKDTKSYVIVNVISGDICNFIRNFVAK